MTEQDVYIYDNPQGLISGKYSFDIQLPTGYNKSIIIEVDFFDIDERTVKAKLALSIVDRKEALPIDVNLHADVIYIKQTPSMTAKQMTYIAKSISKCEKTICEKGHQFWSIIAYKRGTAFSQIETQVITNIINSEYMDAKGVKMIDWGVFTFTVTYGEKDLKKALDGLVRKGYCFSDEGLLHDPSCGLTHNGYEMAVNNGLIKE